MVPDWRGKWQISNSVDPQDASLIHVVPENNIMKQVAIIITLAGLIFLSIYLRREKPTTAIKMTDFPSVYVLLAPGTPQTADGKIPRPLPLVYQPLTIQSEAATIKGDGLVAYSNVALIPPGSTYCEMSIAQIFNETIEDERSFGIMVNPGDPKLSMAVSDGDVSVAMSTLLNKSELAFSVSSK